MALRWRMLAVLFVTRMAMAVQYQLVGSVSPLMIDAYGVDLAEIGFLIGLYFAPGVVLALPGGWLGARFGDKRLVSYGLALMLAGSLLALAGQSWAAEIAGRIVAGVGGILLNILMTKMVADWFTGREIATAMGIFVNSWPVGIALALIVLPAVASSASLTAAGVAVAAFVAACLGVFAIGYHAPRSAAALSPGARERPDRGILLTLTAAGAVWGAYNAALGVIFGFGPAFLAERGWDIVAAGRTTSLVLWLVALSVPLGGFVADRSGRPNTVILASLALTSLSLAAVVFLPGTGLWFSLAGLFAGLAAGPVMSLPARVLAPATRAVGMGVFFTVYYLLMMVLPALAGLMADLGGGAAASVLAGILFSGIAATALWAFHRLAWSGETPSHPRAQT